MDTLMSPRKRSPLRYTQMSKNCLSLVLALAVSAPAAAVASQRLARPAPPQAPPKAESQSEPDDAPTLSTDDFAGVSSRNGRSPLPANLALGQLGEHAAGHYYDIYTIGGLRIVDVYLAFRGVTPA